VEGERLVESPVGALQGRGRMAAGSLNFVPCMALAEAGMTLPVEGSSPPEDTHSVKVVREHLVVLSVKKLTEYSWLKIWLSWDSGANP
jgi:hypothetical protein